MIKKDNFEIQILIIETFKSKFKLISRGLILTFCFKIEF